MKKVIVLMLAILLLTSACSLFNKNTVPECEELSTDSLRNTCYAELGILREDLNLCDQTSTEESKFYCYEGIAAKTNAAAICDDIENSYWQNICYKDVGINLAQADLCTKSENLGLRNECLLNVSVGTQTTSSCSLIGDEPQFVQCYTRIAVAQKSVTPCFEMNAPSLVHDQCIFNVAKVQKDPATCNHMRLSTTREICFERVKELADEAKQLSNTTNSTSN